MSFDFGTIKAWVSWPIDYFKDKWNQLSPEKRTVAAYALGVFSILSVVSYVYTQWKWSTRKTEVKKDKTVDTIHDKANILLKLKSTSLLVEPIQHSIVPPQVDERKTLVKVPSPKAVEPLKNLLPKEEPKVKEDKKASEVIVLNGVGKEKIEEPKENFIFEGEREKEILKKGKLTLKGEVVVLEGEFKVQGDALTGKGRISFSKGVVFEGEYDKGVFKKGRLVFNQAEKILDKPLVKKPLTYILDGEFKLSSTFFIGKGKVTFDENFENGTYEGGIVDGVCDSVVDPLKIIRGALVIGKNSFEGAFKKGIFVGGVKIINGVSYEGEFPIGEKKNLIVTLPNKKKFAGSYISNQGDGEGLMIDGDEVREGKFEKGQLVKGKIGLLKEPYTIKEGTFKDGVFLDGNIEEEKNIWKVKLKDGVLKGIKTSEKYKARGLFDAKDFHLIEGVINYTIEDVKDVILPPPQIETQIGSFDPVKGFYGISRFNDGNYIMGAQGDQNYKVIYKESDQSAKIGKFRGNRLEIGVLRDETGQVQIGIFDEKENLILGLHKLFQCKYTKFVHPTKKLDEKLKKLTFETKTLPSNDKVLGWFDEKGVCQFGVYVDMDKVGGGIFDEKGSLVVGIKSLPGRKVEEIVAVFESDLPIIGRWVNQDEDMLDYGKGVITADKKKYFGEYITGSLDNAHYYEGIFSWDETFNRPDAIDFQNGLKKYPFSPNADLLDTFQEGFWEKGNLLSE